MASQAQSIANQANAARSTGPRTGKGKAVAARNAVKHGLLAEAPVIPGEAMDEWEAFRDGVLQSLGASGVLESQLACRVASVLWKMRRATAFETASTAVEIDKIADRRVEAVEQPPTPFYQDPKHEYENTLVERLVTAERDVPDLRDKLEREEATSRRLERILDCPEQERFEGSDAWALFHALRSAVFAEGDEVDIEDDSFLGAVRFPLREVPPLEAYEWDEWTAGMIRRGCEVIAKTAGWSAKHLVGRAVLCSLDRQRGLKAQLPEKQKKVNDLRRRVRIEEDRLRVERMLPGEAKGSLVIRYETHLTKQLTQFLQLLEGVQVARAGRATPLPPVVEMPVETAEDLDGPTPAEG